MLASTMPQLVRPVEIKKMNLSGHNEALFLLFNITLHVLKRDDVHFLYKSVFQSTKVKDNAD